MDGPGAPAGPGGASTAPPAFYGFWPRMAEERPAAPRLMVASAPGATTAASPGDATSRRLD